MITPENPMEQLLQAVARERGRQALLIKEGKIDCDCSDPATAKEKQVAVLSEEFGEAVIELMRIRDGRLRFGAAKTELIQLAAVAVAIAESLEEVAA